MGLLHDVDKHVADRSVKEVLAEDREAVESVGEKLVALMLGCEHWERFFPDLRVELQPKLMYRIHLFNGDGVDVRLHLFQDASETYVHSHRASFHSVCLYGSYVNEIWDACVDLEGKHFRFNRTKDEVLRRPGARCSGALVCKTHWKHLPGSAYFLQARTYHRIVQASGEVLTLYIKGKDKPCDTIALNMQERPDWKGTNAMEQTVADCTVKNVLKKARTLINNGRRA